MKIVFMGSPDFAIPALKYLINSNHEVVSVYTQAPKPAGRGYKEKLTAINLLANQHNILVKTPKNFKKTADIEEFKKLGVDLAVVIAYGIILPQVILDIPKYGAVNIHPSRLPKYRGAAPLQRTIMGGERETSICIIKMDSGIDTGDILAKIDLELEQNITASILHDKCAEIGGKLLLEVINNLNDLTPIRQEDSGASYAAKISKEEARIDFGTESAYFIDCKIRALNPFPGTYFHYEGKIIKIKSAIFSDETHNYQPGSIIDDKMSIACSGGIIKPLVLQREGKKEMKLEEFIKGFKIPPGTIIQ